MVLDVVDLHADVALVGRYKGCDGAANLHSVELVLAYIECSPHVAHYRYRHNRRACSYEFAYLRIYIAYLASHLRYLHCLVDVACNLGYSTLGTAYLCGGCLLLFHACSVDSHVVLALRCLDLCLESLVVGKCLVAFLRCHNALVEQALYTGVRLLCDIKTCLCLLKYGEGSAYLLLACSVVGHLVHSACRILCRLGLSHLGTYLRGVEDGEGVAHVHVVALFYTQLKNTSRHLA